MTYPLPATGVFVGTLHLFPVRIYYEDTDLSGIVYHANYLRYMERARSDWIAHLGMNQRAFLEEAQSTFFVIRGLQMDFFSPARLEDALVVESTILAMGGASGQLRQRIVRPEADGSRTRLTEAVVRVAFVGGDGRPKRLPKQLQSRMSELVVETS
jgi:acyl-CoA thioester hydrolase